ncbi:MAG: DUF3987 domain-containing protein [Bacteroidales bacterium]
MEISTKEILIRSDNGLDFYKFVIPGLVLQGNKCKNIKNPFYNDTKPSLSIFLKSGQWMFRDHGNSDFAGDVFTFAAFHYNLSLKTDFIQILNKMSDDLHLNIQQPEDKKEYDKIAKQLYHIQKTAKTAAIEYQKSRGLTKHQHFYQSNAYKNYPASVVFVNHNNTGFERRNIATDEELKEKDLPKTQYSGVKENTLFVSGYNPSNDTVFICEGPNNALSFVEIGYSAIATFGASNLPSANLLNSYIKNKTVILAGDGDEAGDKFNTQLAFVIFENQIPVTNLKAIVFPDSKDANDLLIENGLSDLSSMIQIVDMDKLKQIYDSQLALNDSSEVSSVSINPNENNILESEENHSIPKMDFPVTVFPDILQEFIFATNETLKFPIDYLCASILFAVSVAIGNSLKIQVKSSWIDNAVLYIAIVGRSGINKSHPLSFALEPIFEIDKEYFREYEKALSDYDLIAELTNKERLAQGIEKPIKPCLKQIIVSDLTPEALNDLHSNNKRGLGLYKDELAGWINEFNRYHKGGDQQFWLSNWSGKAIKVNRKSSKPIFIPHPFISVCGTIQTSILNEFNKDNMTKNGFIDRILFVFPEDLKKPYYDESELSTILVDSYKEIIRKIISFPMNTNDNGEPVSTIIQYSSDAKTNFIEWQNYNTDLINDPKIAESIKCTYSKLDTYISRFALILQVIYWACGRGDLNEISLKALENATKLVEYFRQTASRVNIVIENSGGLDSIDKKQFAKLLHEKGISYREIGQILGVGKSTVGNMLK